MGSREAKPLWTASEFSKAVLEVVIGDHSQIMKKNAIEVAGKVAQKGRGAENAARLILEELMFEKSWFTDNNGPLKPMWGYSKIGEWLREHSQPTETTPTGPEAARGRI